MTVDVPTLPKTETEPSRGGAGGGGGNKFTGAGAGGSSGGRGFTPTPIKNDYGGGRKPPDTKRPVLAGYEPSPWPKRIGMAAAAFGIAAFVAWQQGVFDQSPPPKQDNTAPLVSP